MVELLHGSLEDRLGCKWKSVGKTQLRKKRVYFLPRRYSAQCIFELPPTFLHTKEFAEFLILRSIQPYFLNVAVKQCLSWHESGEEAETALKMSLRDDFDSRGILPLSRWVTCLNVKPLDFYIRGGRNDVDNRHKWRIKLVEIYINSNILIGNLKLLINLLTVGVKW